MLKEFLAGLAKSKGKIAFIQSLDKSSKILDVGCGNNSPYSTKKICTNCHYTGLDVADYNQTKPNLADDYIIAAPHEFTEAIKSFGPIFDAIIVAHNLEHCNDRWGTLTALTTALKPGGRIYISFPSKKSLHLPSRGGTLNYYDDKTHKEDPPDFEQVISTLEKNGMQLLFTAEEYKPFLMWLFGLLTEPYSRLINYNCKGTWAYHGFETVIWAEKI